jgi:hypothetical protein
MKEILLKNRLLVKVSINGSFRFRVQALACFSVHEAERGKLKLEL